MEPTHFYEGYFYRDINFVTKTLAISPVAIWLYLGDFLLDRYQDGLKPCHWPAGTLYLLTATLAVISWRKKRLGLLCWLFWTVFLFFTVLPFEAGEHFWWASMTIIPAVVICGEYLRLWPRKVVALFICYLSIRAILAPLAPQLEKAPRIEASKRIESAVRRASMRADSDLKARRDLEWALLHTLQVAGPDARLYGYLARTAYAQEQLDRARYFARRALERDADVSFSALVGREVQGVAYAGPSHFELDLEDDWNFEELHPDRAFLIVPVSGHIDPGSGSLGRLDLAVAVNGRIEAVTQTYEGPGSSFAAIVPGTVFKVGSNQVEVFVISESGDGPSLASIRKKRKDAVRYSLAQAASGVPEGIIVSSTGRTIRIVPGALGGAVDGVQKHTWLWHTFLISGWASDGAHREPADEVVVFVDGEANHEGHTTVSRPGLAKAFKAPSLEQAGFRISLSASIFRRDPPPVVRVFAISSKGVASELSYRPEYDDGSRKRWLGKRAAEIKYSLAETAGQLAGKESIVSPSGRTIRIVPGAMRGVIGQVQQRSGSTWFSGWAFDRAHREPVDQVAVFVDGEADHYGHAVVSRSDLVEGFKSPSLYQAGFDLILPGYIFDRDPAPVVRVFAISSTGVASELRYRLAYEDGGRELRLGNR